MTLFHITTPHDWESAKAQGAYAADSLATEGFIHFSLAEQVEKVANQWFKGRTGPLLLAINDRKLTSPLKYEAADGDSFPHLYGPLNLDAVERVLSFEPGADGRFRVPKDAISL